MKPSILGLAQWLPEEVRTNAAWPPEFVAAYGAGARMELTEIAINPDGDAIDQAVARHVTAEAADPFFGTVERRVASPSTTAHEVEIAAARAALEDAAIEGRQIDVVVSVPALPDRIVPTPAAAVAHAVGATNAHAFGIEWPCASSITALELACALIESGRARHVLATQSHLMTRAHPFMHPASPNLGDAATAVVIGPADHGGILATRLVTHGEFFDAVTWRRRKGDDAPWWEAGGALALGSYNSDQARQLVKDTVRIGCQTVRELLDRAQSSAAEVDLFVSVQPRRWVPHAIAEAAGLTRASTVETFQKFAHLGACGPFANLIEARNLGLLRRGTRAVLYAQGAGFTRAAALLEWC